MRQLLSMALSVVVMALTLVATAASAGPTSTSIEQDVDIIGSTLADPKLWIPIEISRFNENLRTSFQNDPGAQEAFSKYPELKSHLTKKLNDRISLLMQQELPTMKENFQRIILKNMTSAHIHSFSQFVSTPFGKHQIAAVASDAAQSNGRGTPDIEPSVADTKIAMDFLKSGGVAKLEQIGPQIEAARDQWFDNFHSSHQSELNDIAVKETELFIAGQNS